MKPKRQEDSSCVFAYYFCPSNIFRRASQLGVTLTKHNGRQPRSVQENWQQFLGDTLPEAAPVPAPEAPRPLEGVVIQRQEPSMRLNVFSMRFSGKIDASMVANSLLHMIGGDTEGDLTVTFSAKSLANS